ncbi:MAG: OsmC family protein [Spirochaetaceae bacterium]|nr:OsmC family protein [Spirochaetaceae bacterium]
MANKIIIEFQNGFQGVCRNESGSSLEVAPDKWRPYELLQTALASCMYSTFLDVVNKKKLDYDKVVIAVDGEKIDDIPSFLKKVDITFTVHGANKEDEKILARFEKSLKLAEKYCSIYNTLNKIAELNSTLIFK